MAILGIVQIEALALEESVGMTATAGCTNHLFEGAIDGLLRRLSTQDNGGVPQELVVDVDHPLAHDHEYSSSWAQAPHTSMGSPAVMVPVTTTSARRPPTPCKAATTPGCVSFCR